MTTLLLSATDTAALLKNPGSVLTIVDGHPLRLVGYPSFRVLLTRLLDHRKLDIVPCHISQAASVPESELQAVPVVPSPSLLRRLAPALSLRTADLTS